MTKASSLPEYLATSPRILAAFVATAVMLVSVSAVRFQAPQAVGLKKVLTDFDAFHIAGQMAARGQAADAYHAEALLKVQHQISGTPSFMPWTYPPPFTLFMQGMSHLPVGVAYALFALLSFAFYLIVIHRIAGKRLPGVLVAVLPAVIVNLRTGQNGFLTAGLIGTFLLLYRDRKTVAGLPLGLMVIKPHLAAGVGLMALLGRRWSALAVAALVALAALAASTWAYGWEIWAHFLGAVRETGRFLALGYYPLFRMNSIYAALYSYGLPAPAAMAGQGLGALIAVGLLVWGRISNLPFRFQAASACVVSLFVSPYGYDYDLTILGIALAFVLPDLMERCSAREIAGLLALSWLACGFGVGVKMLLEAQSYDYGEPAFLPGAGVSWPALIAPAQITLCLIICRMIRRSRLASEISIKDRDHVEKLI